MIFHWMFGKSPSKQEDSLALMLSFEIEKERKKEGSQMAVGCKVKVLRYLFFFFFGVLFLATQVSVLWVPGTILSLVPFFDVSM